MKSLYIYRLWAFVLLLLGAAACDEALEFREPSGSDASIPGAITNVTVENLPGKAKLTYDIPEGRNLLYVKAVYELKSGETREVKSTYYDNTIMVEGFADTLEHEVALYAVSRNEILSEPTNVTIKPLEAPIWGVFNSIEITNAFGGYDLTAENPEEENVSIFVLKKNVFGEFEMDNQKSVFTGLEQIQSQIRGLDTLDYEFKILVGDNWGNTTDTLTHVVQPIYETQLDPSNFEAFVLPGDAPQVTNGARLEYAWDGRLGWPYTSFTLQSAGGPDPHIITFDTGVEAKLSRIWIQPFPELNPPQYYFLTSLRKFEVYGSTNPNLNGALDDSWTLLGSYEVIKPSGSAYGQDTPEDREIASKGWNFDVDLDAPKVRYIRIRCLENWSGGTAQSINEIELYGDPR